MSEFLDLQRSKICEELLTLTKKKKNCQKLLTLQTLATCPKIQTCSTTNLNIISKIDSLNRQALSSNMCVFASMPLSSLQKSN